jgi:four helix bundle protein
VNAIKKYDLEERLVKFAVMITTLAESLPESYVGKYLSGQIIRSGISPALNYGEAKNEDFFKGIKRNFHFYKNH